MRIRHLWTVGILATACAGDEPAEELATEHVFATEPDRLSGLIAITDTAGAPLAPVHAHLRRDGSVLLIGKTGSAGILTPAQLAATPSTVKLAPATAPVEAYFTSIPPYVVTDLLFCAGHTQLADGSFFSVGGTRDYNDVAQPPGTDYLVGLDYGTVLDGTWQRTAARMTISGPTNATRWYPQATRLADGRILITGGWDMPLYTPPGIGPLEGTRNVSAEIYDPKTGPAAGTFTPLTTSATTPLAIFNRDYTHAFVLPTGADDGFVLGESSAPVMFSLARPGVWSTRIVPRPGTILAPDGTSPMTPNDGASSAMLPIRLQDGQWGYRNGAVLVAGGAHWTQSERSIDVYDPIEDRWCVSGTGTGACTTPRLDMAGRRHHPSTVVLPDGRMLVIAGHDDADPGSTLIRKALLVDPATGFQLTEGQAAMGEIRGYHTVTLLLPDGRVLVGGGRSAGPTSVAEDERTDLRFYSPPYLDAARLPLRPQLTSAPAILRYNTAASIGVSGQATEAALIGLGSMTHSFDSNQRHVQLALTPAAGGATIVGPRDARTAPPGYYMLFVLGPSRTPSVARIVRVCGSC